MGAPDEFHDNAHPEAREITGDRRYGEWGQCVARAKSAGRRCKGYAQGPHGKCNTHGGDTPTADENPKQGRGEQDGNDNAVSHELYSQSNHYYKRRDDAGQAIIDSIFEDYAGRYVSRHGEPAAGDEAMLFKVAVNIHKQLKADEWAAAKPETLDADHPLIDRSEKKTAQGESYYEYVVTAVDKAEHRLSTRTRQWLKDMDLLGSPDEGADVEVNISQRMWDDLTDYYNEG